jgi:hypothetical protein
MAATQFLLRSHQMVAVAAEVGQTPTLLVTVFRAQIYLDLVNLEVLVVGRLETLLPLFKV